MALGYPCCGSLVTGQHLPEYTMDTDPTPHPTRPGGPPDDAFAVAVARAKMSEINEHRAARAATAAGGYTDIEVARIIAYFLKVTERKLGMPESRVYRNLDEYIHGIVVAAQGGKLDPGTYRALWDIWRGLGQAPRRSGTETEAPFA